MEKEKTYQTTNDIMFRRIFGQIGNENLNVSDSYKELKKVIVILITDYKLTETEGYNKYHHIYELRDEEDDNILSKKVQINLIELNKFKESGENPEKEEWIAFLKAKEVKDMAKIATKNDWLQKAKEEFEYLSSQLVDQQEIEERRWELRDIISMCEFHEEEGMKKGIEKGLEKGRKDSEKKLKNQAKQIKKQIVKSMYDNNISVEQISKIVKIDKKEVESILQEV